MYIIVVTSVSVILNGNEPEFTNALGQKVPKPQPSLQVASPIDLLNPDRYEFYTFDEHGELVKRLMTVEEIQSIVANGDGEGPTIIHHGLIEDRDPEKNVEDIVNSVQSVLNKEVESNKKTSMENLPVFDTPDVSSTWSMILPAIFGNTGSVDVFSHQKPQQIAMTPESEIIETSTKKVVSTAAKKSKPSKRKPGQKRKSTTTTTEITPQVIQEELDSQESVYTGMQQYQNLATSMQSYGELSQLHIQPIYHKLPEVEASTRHAFINVQEVVRKPIIGHDKDELLFTESPTKKPISVQHKPLLPPHRVKNPNGSNTSTKQPLFSKQKLKRKPTVSTSTPISTAIASFLMTRLSITTDNTTTPISKIKTAESTISAKPITTTTTTMVPTTTLSTPTIFPHTSRSSSTTRSPNKKKKKPIYTQVNATTTILDVSTNKLNLTAERRRPSPPSHKRRPNPTHQHAKYPHEPSVADLTLEGTAHREVYNTVSSTTMFSSPSPNTTTVETPLVVQDVPGNRETIHGFESFLLPTSPPSKSSTIEYENTTANIAATSATSGYPVPSYDLLADEPEHLDSYQHKKQPTSSPYPTRNKSKPYQQDVHTLQSFGQIMQTLKYPARASEKLAVNIDQSSEKFSLKPIYFESYQTINPLYYPLKDGTKQSTLKDFETTSILPYQENTSPNDESNKADDEIIVRPNHYIFTNKLEDITSTTPLEEVSNYNTDTTDSTQLTDIMTQSFVTEISEKEVQRTADYSDHTQKLEADIYIKPSKFTEPLTLINDNTASSMTDGFTDQLKIETSLPDTFLKAELNTKDSLNPQLSLEVIKSSGQINMSEFQTHAATIASTMIDGGNTLPSNYNNKTNDDIALLLSDVVYQMSNNNSKKQVTNFNANRFSNQAQLDLSFTMSPTKDASQFKDEHGNRPNYKPINEHFGNQQLQHLDVENLNKNSNSYVGTTQNPDITTFKEMQDEAFDTNSDNKLTKQHTNKEDINSKQTEPVNELSEEYTDENFNESTSTAFLRTNDAITVINAAQDENPTTISNQQYNPEDFLEADDSKGTTTLVNGLLEETTTLSGGESLSRVVECETLSEENIELCESQTNNNASTSPTTTLSSASELKVTETSEAKLEPANTESATSFVETTENTFSNENIRTPIDVTELFSIPTSHFTENSDQVAETTIESMPSKGSKVTNTVKIEIEKKYTTENYQMNEGDESIKSLAEDPYIKLGEPATSTSSNVGSQSTFALATEQYLATLERPSSIQSLRETNIASLLLANHNESYEDSDQEDEEDQFGIHLPKQPNLISTTTLIDASRTPTTTDKPKVTTTRRLNTLKPVSYFNKKPAYALYQEPLHNKQSFHSSNTKHKENIPLKVVAYSMQNLQQRPMQRPPQLSNLIISSTQSARPAVKFELSPFNSKGLEASLVKLDEDILTFAKLCNELAFTYWKSITSEKISTARSLVMSPFALTSMLSMVFLGARGTTSGEMNDVLKLDNMVTFNPHLVFKNITDSVEKCIDKEIATTAFVREIYSDRANGKVLQFFKEKTQQLYAGHVEEVNFHVVNDIIRRRTNLLVKRHTMGKVLEYLRTNSVWVNGPLATISANLFQTDCSGGSTKDRDGEIFFQVHPTVLQRRLVPVPAVLFKSGFTAGYEPNLDATVVAFGRIQDTTSIIYVMPGHLSSVSPLDNLDRLESQLMETAISGNAWSNLLTSLMERSGMEVQIPRFSHRSFINATTGLQKMGFRGLFKSDYADLGGLTGSSNRDIYLSDMIQINTFSTCGEAKIADHHHVELYPSPSLRKRNKDVNVDAISVQDSSEAIIDFGSIVQDPVTGRGFYDDLLNPKYLELPLPLRPRQARVPEAPRIRFDKPFVYFVRHNPTGMILFMGRFNPRLLP